MSHIEIKEIEGGRLQARGFLLEEQGDWILYPEPALKSCCRHGDLNRGVHLLGDIPKRWKGQCITVQGKFEGDAIDVIDATSSLFPFWILPAAVLLMIVFSKAKKK